MNKKYKYLDKINFPSDIKKLSQSDLKILADEVREEMIDAVSETGGHLGAGLGVVELTVALHYIFITPNDKRMWESIENLMEELKNPEHVPENKKVNQKEFKKRNRNRKRNSKSRKYYQKSRN